ncbi:MAG: fatty-acid--CoA ligase [Rhodospirillaceae bacterium]|nr:fatty-acid--CoA ligase [Rhodospirillaceae bacterium]
MLTMLSALDNARRLHGDRPAIVDEEQNFTWSNHVGRIAKAAGLLAGLGIGPGDRYGIICENSFRYTELIHAGYWGGGIAVPINHRLAAPEILHILEDADCQILILGKPFLSLAETAELSPWKDKTIYVGPADSEISQPQYEALLSTAPSAPQYPVEEDDLAILLYTGGTTGRSKGVQLSHKNVYSNGMQVAIAMGAVPTDIYLHAAPMFHAADLLSTGFTLVGAAHCYLPVFTPTASLEVIQKYSVTATMKAPTMIIMNLTNSMFGEYDTSSLRIMLYGSSPMAAEWVQKSIEGFPHTQIVQGYGLTETSPILTFLDWDIHKNAVKTGDTDVLRSAGRPLVGLDMKITDDNGGDLPLGDVGEVTVRGPQVSKGYLNRPEETERTFRNGWFHTGDVGRMDEHGLLYLMDRKKDMIVSGGENIYTSEVEAALYQHADIQECAVVGVPDEKYGEALFAVIVPTEGKKLYEADIINHCRERIGGYKIPRRMDFVTEMPKSAMGKILKNELRRSYGSNDG